MKRRWIPIHYHTCVYTVTYKTWLDSTTPARRLPKVCPNSSMLSDYVSNMCTGKFMGQTHIESAMTVNYQGLMTHKRLHPHTSALTLPLLANTSEDREKGQDTILAQSVVTISTKMVSTFRAHLPPKASLEDCMDDL